MWRIASFVFFVTFCITKLGFTHANPHVPCYFIFGDSLSDAGNNNGLNTKAKANYHPYGVDFLGGRPTGRFTNGRTTVDVIAEHLGFQGYIPPFSTAYGNEILKGVNYASGSAGIRRETGEHLGYRVSFSEQLQNHKTIISKLDGLLKRSVRAHLHKCLYTINIGSNDYINNYFMPKHYITSRLFNSTDHFADSLIQQYSNRVKTLYKNGARKVALFGLGLIGCSLAEVVRLRPKTLCVNSMNEAVELFNFKLKSLVDNLNRKLPGAKITFINNQAIQLGPSLGFTVINEPCCKVREDFQCKESTSPCQNRNAHIFWDGFHPTEAVNRIVGGRAFKALHPLDVHPYDISSLIKL